MNPLFITSLLSLYILMFISFKYFSQFASLRKYALVYGGLSLFSTAYLFLWVLQNDCPIYVAYLMSLTLMFFSFYLIFEIDFIYAYFGAIHFVFYDFVIRMAFLSIYSLVSGLSIDFLKHNLIDYLTIYQISMIFTIVLFLYWDSKKLTKDKMLLVLRNRQEFLFILMIKSVLGFYMMIITYGSRFASNDTWFAAVHLITSLLLIFMAYSTLQNGVESASSLEYEKQTVALKNQLTMQINHYKAYQKYTQGFREFRHDYKRMLSVINFLLRSGKYEEAIEVLDEMGVVIASDEVMHIQYSNYPLLDAVLQEFSNRCSESDIDFSASLYWDENINMDELTIVRIFTNLLSNAYEACDDSLESNFIKIESRLSDLWLDVKISNSFDGIYLEGLKSTKNQEQRHRGLGTKIVRQTIEEMGGMFSWEVDVNTFIVYLHIPRSL